ncbi:MAG: response regulator [Elusimicrobia bacterium]|nr:response regulator [Elusimicrobiota bacterium]
MPTDKKTILVVEDHESVRSLLKRLLEEENYRVIVAVDGEEALSRVAQEVPDLILLDVMLPKLDGMEVCRRVRRDPAAGRVPIMMLTARGAPADQAAGLRLGANDYVVKPFDAEELKGRITALFLKVERDKGL